MTYEDLKEEDVNNKEIKDWLAYLVFAVFAANCIVLYYSAKIEIKLLRANIPVIKITHIPYVL